MVKLLPGLLRLPSPEGSHRHQRAFMNLISTWPCFAGVSTGGMLALYTELLLWGSQSFLKHLPDFSGNFPFARSNLILERGHRKHWQKAISCSLLTNNTVWREPWNSSPEPLFSMQPAMGFMPYSQGDTTASSTSSPLEGDLPCCLIMFLVIICQQLLQSCSPSVNSLSASDLSSSSGLKCVSVHSRRHLV